MSEVYSIEQLKQMAITTISIPDFEGAGTIKVKVQRPRLMAMASQGKIPNHLMSIASDMIMGRRKKSGDVQINDVASMIELYCQACLVEPSYDEFKGIITDDQMSAIFDWGTEGVKKLDSFRTDKADGTNNNNGETLQEETECDIRDR